MRILFVHGIAQDGRSEAELKAEWIGALELGMKAANLRPCQFDVALPYFGNDLLWLCDEFATRSESRAEEMFIEEALQQMNAGPEDTRHPDQNDEDGLYRPLEGDYDKRGGSAGAALPQSARKILRHLDTTWPDLTNWNLRLFLRVVYGYVNNERVSNAINAKVAIGLSPNEPTLLIGHSLGSVIAYNVLSTNLDVPWRGFLTVGSPLGIKAIANRLPRHNPRVPVLRKNCWSKYGSVTWINAFDQRDIVALNPLAPPLWPPLNSIDNKNHINNLTSNRHGIIGYLSDPEIAAAINAALDPEM